MQILSTSEICTLQANIPVISEGSIFGDILLDDDDVIDILTHEELKSFKLYPNIDCKFFPALKLDTGILSPF